MFKLFFKLNQSKQWKLWCLGCVVQPVWIKSTNLIIVTFVRWFWYYPEAKKILEEAKDEFAYELPEKTFEYGG